LPSSNMTYIGFSSVMFCHQVTGL